MRIILFILGFILISIWLAFIISIGVAVGIKTINKELSEKGGK